MTFANLYGYFQFIVGPYYVLLPKPWSKYHPWSVLIGRHNLSKRREK